jgi:hypothetical protein
VPITIGQVGQMAMGVTDSVMIGRAGTVPLAASSFGVGIFNIFFIIGIGLLTPVAVFASRARGAGRHDEAGEFLRHGLLLGLGSGVVEVGVILFLGFHLEWFRQQPEVLAAVNPFFLLLGFSLVPSLVYLALRQFAESMDLHLRAPRRAAAWADRGGNLDAHLALPRVVRDLHLAALGSKDAGCVAPALAGTRLVGAAEADALGRPAGVGRAPL